MNINFEGFLDEELINIDNLTDFYTAYEKFGEITKENINRRINQIKTESTYESDILKASESLESLIQISVDFKDVFTTSDGINHLERYLEALNGLVIGSGVSKDEIALTQIKDQIGCQTLLIQNNLTKEIAGFHIEEDSANYDGKKDPFWGKKWVKMKFADRVIQYCAYAGTISLGSTSGVVESSKDIFYQAADFISPTVEGNIWANALSFMTIDCADLGLVRELVGKINNNVKKLPQPLFWGGYILHLVQVKNNNPELFTIEFGGNILKIIDLLVISNRKITAGVNLPISKELIEIEDYYSPRKIGESEEKYNLRSNECELMSKRYTRLITVGKELDIKNQSNSWGKDNSFMALENELKNNDHGEWSGPWFSGYSNYIVAQHNLVYFSIKDSEILVRKDSPSKY